jgi:hypothetical protein
MGKLTWAEVEERRLALPRRLSRAEFTRRAGISESTMTKGVKDNTPITKTVREKLELALEAARIEQEETAKQMGRLKGAIEERLG